MSGSINTFLAGANATAHAVADLTTTNTATATLAAPGLAIGYSAAVAAAQNTDPVVPHTSAATEVGVSGGYITSGHTGHWSLDFLMGSTPVSVDVSVTTVSTYGSGDFQSGYSVAGLAGSSLHGLF
jgi:hypothetical protein